jgi:hypothetical protein
MAPLEWATGRRSCEMPGHGYQGRSVGGGPPQRAAPPL